MGSVSSPALPGARGLRRMGLSVCTRRTMSAPGLVIFANWFQKRSAPAVIGDAGSDSAPSGESVVSASPHEEFMRRARKMQRRIVKLKKLQERLNQLRDETEFLNAYSEASALDADSDDSDADDEEPSLDRAVVASRRDARPQSGLIPVPIPTASLGIGPGHFTEGPVARIPPPGPSATSEELRQWVAAVVAQSAAWAATVRPEGQTAFISTAAARNRSSISSGISRSNGHKCAGDGPGAAVHEPPTSASWGQSAGTSLPGQASSSNGGGSSSSSSSDGSSGIHRNSSSSISSRATASPQSARAGRPTEAVDGGGVRRYTVRYSSRSSKPVFVQMPSPGGARAGPAAAGTSAVVGAAATPAGEPASAGAEDVPSLLPSAQVASAAAQRRHQEHPSTTAQSLAAASAASAVASAAVASPVSPRATTSWATSLPDFPSPSSIPSVAVPPSDRQPPNPQQQQAPLSTSGAPAVNVAAPGDGSVPVAPAASAAFAGTPSPSPFLDPSAELRTTIFPESLTSSNPYTLYDIPLPPLPLRESWQTAAERRKAAAEAEAEENNDTTAVTAAAPPPPPPRSGAAAPAATAAADRAERPRGLVFVTAEAAPWSKTGGLGDVMGALPRALAARGHRVMVVSPRYLSPSTEDRYRGLDNTGVQAALDLGAPHSAGGGGGVHHVGFFHTHKDGVDWVFVDHMSYHREGTPYSNAHGTYGDNLFRFSLLCLAACEAPLLLHIGGHRSGNPPGLPYGQDVTFIANDWHAGLVPVYVAARYRRHGVFKDARCVLALHNLAHQGAHPPHCFGSLGLPPEWYGALEWVQPPGVGGTSDSNQRIPTINILKAALVTADQLVTVSPAYAWEITVGRRSDFYSEAGAVTGAAATAGGPQQQQQGPGDGSGTGGGHGAGAGGSDGSLSEDHGMGLGSLLRQRAADLAGVINGIDTAEWDPRTDPYLTRNYHEGRLGGKGLCKAALQAALQLPVDPAAPLLGFIGRLDYQKGPDLVLQALPKLVAAGCQVVLLGSGAPDYEEAFRAAAAAFPTNVRAHVGFSVPLSHRILAASDILLMPSRFEPCGLNQLYAMRYGTVPVAHGTGGLRDTIDDVKPFLGEPPRKAESLDELFSSGLAWGRRTASRSADDPSTNNAEYYQPFQDYFGTSGRYGAVNEDGDDEYGGGYDEDGADRELPEWRRGLGLGRSRDPGTGWTFAPASCDALLDAVTAALAVYEHHPDKWRRIQLAGMRRDFSWGRAARQWETVIEGVFAAAAYCK